MDSSPLAVPSTSDFAPATSKEFLFIQATIEPEFTLNHVHNMTGTYSQMHPRNKYSEHSSVIWPVGPNGWLLVYELKDSGFECSRSHLNCRFRVCVDKEVLDIQTTIQHGFTLKYAHDITKAYSQMYRGDRYLEHSSIIYPVWSNGWLFVYKLSRSRFESRCSH